MYTTDDIAQELNIKRRAVNSKIRKLNLIPVNIQGRRMYSSKQLDTIKSKEAIVKYYPMKTIETFYIYESKMNNQ